LTLPHTCRVFVYGPTFYRRLGGILVLVIAVAASATCARADSDQMAIKQRLQRWTAAFNARDAAGVCDLFAPDLVYSVPEVIHGRRETLCGNLSKLFDHSGLQLRYDEPDIHEVVISGDVAIVRLSWTLTGRAPRRTSPQKREWISFVDSRMADGRSHALFPSPLGPIQAFAIGMLLFSCRPECDLRGPSAAIPPCAPHSPTSAQAGDEVVRGHRHAREAAATGLNT
jgi:ketosteroid isomerase-like protein